MLSSLEKQIKCAVMNKTNEKIKKLTTEYKGYQKELKKLQDKLNKLRGLSIPSVNKQIVEEEKKSITKTMKVIKTQMSQVVDELVNIGYCKGKCVGKKCMDERRAKVIKLLEDNKQYLKF